MDNEERTHEIYNELKKKDEKQDNSVLRKLPRNTKLIFLAVIGGVVWAIYNGKIERTNGMLVALIFGVVIYMLAKSEGSVYTRPLSEEECRIKLYKQLRNKQLYPLGQHYQINPGIKIIHHPSHVLKNLEGKPWKWILGVRFFDPDTTLSKYYAAICNPYTGDLKGLKELKGGIDELDFKDVQLIPDFKMFSEKKYHDYMGKYWQRDGGPR